MSNRKRNRSRKPGNGPRPFSGANKTSGNRTMSVPNVPFVGTERLTSVIGGGPNFVRTFYYNPGLEETFSVGHFQAQNYDKYLMTGKNAIRYTPACSQITTGSVYILIDYDPTDRAPSTEEEFADNELTLTCPSWGKMSAPIQASRMDNCRKLIRTGPNVESKLLTDACAIHIGAFGFGDTVGIGHIHIDYSAKLFVRQPTPTTLALPRNTLVATMFEGVIPPSGHSVVFSETKFNTVGAIATTNTFTMRRGTYLVDVRVGLTMVASAPTVYMAVELLLNGVRVNQSPVVFEEPNLPQQSTSLTSSGNIVQCAEGDVLSVYLFHDHTSTVTVINDRSLFTARLV